MKRGRNMWNNEHGVDSVTFFSFASPHRWSCVRDFMEDRNATVNFSVELGDWMSPVVGTCGARPDEELMAGELPDKFDQYADKMGWDGTTRKIERWITDRIGASNRTALLEVQANESMRTGSAPLESMTKSERTLFLKLIEQKKASRERRRLYEIGRKERLKKEKAEEQLLRRREYNFEKARAEAEKRLREKMEQRAKEILAEESQSPTIPGTDITIQRLAGMGLVLNATEFQTGKSLAEELFP